MEHRRKILLVDDEELIRLSFKRELQRFYDVSTASGYDKALQILSGGRFDLLVTDMVMPGPDGLALLKKIKSSYPEMCVIIITGYGETKTVIETLRAGADDLLLKPFDFDRLLQRIDKTFARQEHLNTVRLSEKILATTCDLVALIDKSGMHLSANPAYLQAFGIDRETLLRTSLQDLLGSVQFNTKVAPWLTRCFTGEAVQHLELYRLQDKGSCSMVVSFCPVVAADTTAVSSAVISMTNVKSVFGDTLLLQQNEERLRLVHSISNDGYMDWDLAADNIYYCSNWLKIIGHVPHIAKDNGWSWQDLLHPEDKDTALQDLQDCIDGRTQSLAIEMRLQHGSGHWLWMQMSGKVVAKDGSGKALRLICLMRDISDQKRIHEDFIEHNKLLLLQAAEQTKELDSHNKELQEVNAALTIVLKQRQQDKEMLQERMSENVRSLVEPLVKRLQRTTLDDDQFRLAQEIEDSLQDITSSFITRLTGQAVGLTPMEIQVATHVKQGKATKEIADILCLAPDTINVHRKKIRKKLGLSNKSINLQTFLATLSND